MASPRSPIVSLLVSFQADRLAEDWQAMRALLHHESRLESLAAPGFVLSADELIEAIQGAMAHGVYAVKTWDAEYLSQHSAIAVGRVRYRVGKVGFVDES
jgi:predicted ABC-type ATPase